MQPVVAKLSFNVIEGLNIQMVIGLPSICIFFLDLFKEMLDASALLFLEPSLLNVVSGAFVAQ